MVELAARAGAAPGRGIDISTAERFGTADRDDVLDLGALFGAM
jgi:hypothetical protein